jgi:hypothetical protein
MGSEPVWLKPRESQCQPTDSSLTLVTISFLVKDEIVLDKLQVRRPATSRELEWMAVCHRASREWSW